jgi:hypothetical protein
VTFRPDEDMDETYRFPPLQCTFCGHVHDATTFLPQQGQEHPPVDGDYSLCIECGEPSIFQIGSLGGVTLRRPNAHELAEFAVDHQNAADAHTILRRTRPRRRKRD